MDFRARIDHFKVGASQAIEDLLAAYAEIGFVVSPFEDTLRFPPGIRNGFLYLSPKGFQDYLEFLVVEDRLAFEKAQANGEELYTERSCANGVGVRAMDAKSLHATLVKQGTAVKPVWSMKPDNTPADAPFMWSFVNLEAQAAGLGAFYVQYLKPRKPVEPEIVQGSNGIYALGGLLHDSADPVATATLLAKDFPRSLVRLEGSRLELGCHEIVCRPFGAFVAATGGHTLFQNPDLKLYGALLYTDSLVKTAAGLNGKWKTHVVAKDEILLVPTKYEGLAAVIHENPIEEWKKERLGSGEWLF